MISFQLGAPQIILLAIYVLDIAIVAAHHGEPKEGSYNVFVLLIAFVIQLALLTWGGFF